MLSCFHSAWCKDYANYYQGLWDCLADEPDELSFQRGDLIYIISKVKKKVFFFVFFLAVLQFLEPSPCAA